MLTGSCLCQSVRYAIKGEMGLAENCHCSMCRKAHGAAFSSNALVATNDLKIMGAEHLRSYKSSPTREKLFCSRCGSQLSIRRLNASGFVRLWSDLRPGEDEQAVGYGPPGSDDLLAVKQVEQPIPNIPGFHIALAASSRALVAAFHAAALKNGGSDNGPPGLRPDYGPNYFAAFVVDPEGHRLEAVCKAPD
jgi:catechol 2,3-dioxygenase-like lactoylglutathione lyase family enzyme